jgi:cytochrome c-type biogenesis protein CcmH
MRRLVHPLLRIWLGTLCFAVLLLPTLGAGGAADASQMARFDRLGHQMMCICSCGQILLECNHVGCPSSDGMRAELRAAVDAGLTDKQVYDRFINKYGPTVMAAPVFQGFNILAWVMPAAVLLLGTLGIAMLIYLWKNKPGRFGASKTIAAISVHPSDVSETMRAQIRRETEQ